MLNPQMENNSHRAMAMATTTTKQSPKTISTQALKFIIPKTTSCTQSNPLNPS